MKLKKSFPVTVFSPFQTYYEGEAMLVQATNKSGPFDILEGHANFLCLLLPGTLKIQASEKVSEIPIQKGILQVVNGSTYVFLNI
jgi:F0F1-type ATP synthase epsilon subunit